MDRIRFLLPLAACIAVAAFAVGWSFTFKDVPPMLARGFQPAAFPRFVALLIIGLSALAIVNILRHGETEPAPILPREYWLTVLLLLVFGALALVGDFLFALMIGTVGIAIAWGERNPLVLLGLGIVAPIVTVILFDEVLQVRFPRGFLVDLYYG